MNQKFLPFYHNWFLIGLRCVAHLFVWSVCLVSVLVSLFLSFLLYVGLDAQSKEPVVYACIFVILLGCLGLFAWRNAIWEEFLVAVNAIVSHFCDLLTQTLLCSQQDFGISHFLVAYSHFIFCYKQYCPNSLQCFLVTLTCTGQSACAAGLFFWAMTNMCILPLCLPPYCLFLFP